APDYGVVSDAKAALQALVDAARKRKAAGSVPEYSTWSTSCTARKGQLQRKTHYDEKPIKPQRVYQEMNRAFGRDITYVTTIGLGRLAGPQVWQAYLHRSGFKAGQAGPRGWTGPAALGVGRAKPGEWFGALSGDYIFQFIIEELAVGAQHQLPYLHVVL